LQKSVSEAPTSSFGIPMAAVPDHKGRDISPVLLRQIAKDVGLTADQLVKNL
jgi:hypothetical protein